MMYRQLNTNNNILVPRINESIKKIDNNIPYTVYKNIVHILRKFSSYLIIYLKYIYIPIIQYAYAM